MILYQTLTYVVVRGDVWLLINPHVGKPILIVLPYTWNKVLAFKKGDFVTRWIDVLQRSALLFKVEKECLEADLVFVFICLF